MIANSTHRTRRRVLQSAGTAGMMGLTGCMNSIMGIGGPASGETNITYRDRINALSVYAEVFNETHDVDFTVDPSMKPVQSNYRSLTSEIAAGNAPEVAGLDVIFLPKFAELGALSDIESFYQGLPYKDDFFNALTNDFVRWNDTVFALPFWIDLSLFIYNKEHFREAGLDPENPPVTFQEFIETARALKSAGYETPLANTLVDTAVFFFLPHVWAGGGALFNEDKTECLIAEEPAVRALEFFITLQDENLTTDQTARQGWTHQPYISEETSMAYSNSQFGTIRDASEDLYEKTATAMFPMPSGGSQSSFLGGNCITIMKQTEGDAYDASETFIRWLNSKEGMETTVTELGYVPARKSGFDSEFIKENQDIYSPVERALQEGHPPPMHPQMTQIRSILNNAILRALLGDQSAQESLNRAANDINSLIQS